MEVVAAIFQRASETGQVHSLHGARPYGRAPFSCMVSAATNTPVWWVMSAMVWCGPLRHSQPALTRPYPHAGPLLTARWNEDLVEDCWSDLLRMGGSLKYGQATASGLLRCAKPGQARSLIPVGQIARVSSVKAARTRRFTTSSTPSS
jgi:hypothetical protein